MGTFQPLHWNILQMLGWRGGGILLVEEDDLIEDGRQTLCILTLLLMLRPCRPFPDDITVFNGWIR